MVVDRGDEEDVDICMTDPGHPVTLTVSGKLRALVDVLMGDAILTDVLQQGLLQVEGERDLARRFESLFEFEGSDSFTGGSSQKAGIAVVGGA